MAYFKCVVSNLTASWIEVVSARNSRIAYKIASNQRDVINVTKPVKLTADVAKGVALDYLQKSHIFTSGICQLRLSQARFPNVSSFAVVSMLGTNYISIRTDSRYTWLIVEDENRQLNNFRLHHMEFGLIEDKINDQIIPYLS